MVVSAVGPGGMSDASERSDAEHSAHHVFELRSIESWWPNALMAAYGSGWCFTIPFIGNLYGAELFAVLCLPFLAWRKALSRYPTLRFILAGYGLMFLGLIVADIVNGTPFRDLARGWANPVFAAIALTFVISILQRNIGAFLCFLLATFIFKLIFGDAGYMLRYGGRIALSTSSIFENTSLFKVRFVPFLIPAAALIAFYVYRFGKVWSGLVYLGVAIAFIVLDARSAALAFLAAAGLLILRQSGFRFSAKSIAVIALPTLVAGQLVYIAYVNFSFTHNSAGYMAGQLRQLQNPYNPIELLIFARSDWSIADVVIGDRPVFGHGSWARDADKAYTDLMVERTGVSDRMYSLTNEIALVPTHSFLLTSWVWGGLLAFAGALLVLWAALKTIPPAVLRPSAYSTVAALASALLLWDLLFSPIQVMRTVFPHLMGFLMVLAGACANPSPRGVSMPRQFDGDVDKAQ
jgi:hypothetical protein